MRISDKYKLVKKIGSGAFGEIFKGKQFHIFPPNYLCCPKFNILFIYLQGKSLRVVKKLQSN